MLLFFFLACNRQEPQLLQSKRVDVSLQPELPGNVELSILELDTLFPESALWDKEKKERLWSLLHLIKSPCEAEKGSLLMSLKKGSCSASVRLKDRALRNLHLDDDGLIEQLTVPDSWYPDAHQEKNNVIVELWVDEPIRAKERLLVQLKELNNAHLRICSRSNLEEKVRDVLLPVSQDVSDIQSIMVRGEENDVRCSSSLSKKVRSSPTWFVDGFRLRGFQSTHSIQRLISLSRQEKK